LFSGEDVFKLVKDLSGGEKGRLALAKLIYSNKNVLVLDEPTNHLDIPSREALEDALDAYQGTIITVSHDRFFLDKIATQIFSFESNGDVDIFDGNYSEFHDWKSRKGNEEKGKKGERTYDPPAVFSETVSKTEDPPKIDNLSKNQRQRIENRIREIEESIPRTEAEMSKFSFQMSLPEVVSNHAKLQEITDKFRKSEKQVQALYEEWESLSEEIGG
jgi:ATP-binding cassette subfamily F protein 3